MVTLQDVAWMAAARRPVTDAGSCAGKFPLNPAGGRAGRVNSPQASGLILGGRSTQAISFWAGSGRLFA